MNEANNIYWEILYGLILGLVEGLTEFLPISSTGHLILAAELLAFTGRRAETFEIFIQLGAILAVVVLYRRRFFDLVNLSQPGGFAGIAGVTKLGIACVPAALLGLFFHTQIKHYLFSPMTVAYALIVGGIIMLVLEWRPRKASVHTLEELSYTKVLLVGIAQCFALWPGVSRSGSMIVGGMLFGLSRPVAAEFSFLVAVPIMCMAVGYDLYKSLHFLNTNDIPLFATGFIVAFISAMIAIRGFIAFLQKFSLKPFGWYRIALGLLSLALL